MGNMLQPIGHQYLIYCGPHCVLDYMNQINLRNKIVQCRFLKSVLIFHKLQCEI
jgi:hypothetical protein